MRWVICDWPVRHKRRYYQKLHGSYIMRYNKTESVILVSKNHNKHLSLLLSKNIQKNNLTINN